MTPSGIELDTSRLVAQCLNRLRHGVAQTATHSDMLMLQIAYWYIYIVNTVATLFVYRHSTFNRIWIKFITSELKEETAEFWILVFISGSTDHSTVWYNSCFVCSFDCLEGQYMTNAEGYKGKLFVQFLTYCAGIWLGRLAKIMKTSVRLACLRARFQPDFSRILNKSANHWKRKHPLVYTCLRTEIYEHMSY
jgi:hypothetical protein